MNSNIRQLEETCQHYSEEIKDLELEIDKTIKEDEEQCQREEKAH